MKFCHFKLKKKKIKKSILYSASKGSKEKYHQVNFMPYEDILLMNDVYNINGVIFYGYKLHSWGGITLCTSICWGLCS